MRDIYKVSNYKSSKADIQEFGKARVDELEDLAKKILERFIVDNDIVFGRPCYNWAKLSCTHKDIEGRYIPLLDHAALLVSKSGEKILVSHMYPVSEKEKESFEKWAELRGLSLEIDINNSWYYPGTTWLAVIRVKNSGKLEKYINDNKRKSPLGLRAMEVD